jgi:serine/threonine protein kinase
MSIESPPLRRRLGDYLLLDKIAEGGMGTVYRGRRADGGPVVAIKVIPHETTRNKLLMKRFEQEFRAAALIDHPNVVRALDYSGAPPVPFLVMEYVDGRSLGEVVEKDGRLGEADAVYVLGQVCDGLHAAHKQGLIHRDVKPDNVLVTPDLTAKLTDLGLVRDVESDDNLTRTGKGLGTPHYMAPEQFRNAKHVDVRSDVYSLGATLYMAVTGQVPFNRCSPLDCWMRKTKDELPPPKTLLPGLSDRVDFAIRRAMRANPAERQTSCREFMEDLLGEPWKSRAGTNSGTNLLPPGDDLWYMVFYDSGFPKTVKGSTDTIRRNVRAGVLGDHSVILVSRTKAGPFSPLWAVPEFRDLMLGGYGPAGPPTPLANTVLAGTPAPLPPAALAAGVTSQTPLDRHLGLRGGGHDTPLPAAAVTRGDADKPPTAECDAIPMVTPSMAVPGPTMRSPQPSPDPPAPRPRAGRFGWLLLAAVIALALAIGVALGLVFRS